jgi:hypothetical protein
MDIDAYEELCEVKMKENAEHEHLEACYGLATNPRDSQCKVCMLKEECYPLFKKQVIAPWIKGGDFNVEEMAVVVEMSANDMQAIVNEVAAEMAAEAMPEEKEEVPDVPVASRMPKRSGRAKDEVIDVEQVDAEEKPKRKRGRPKGSKTKKPVAARAENDAAQSQQKKGRPKKSSTPEDSTPKTDRPVCGLCGGTGKVGGKRGIKCGRCAGTGKSDLTTAEATDNGSTGSGRISEQVGERESEIKAYSGSSARAKVKSALSGDDAHSESASTRVPLQGDAVPYPIDGSQSDTGHPPAPAPAPEIKSEPSHDVNSAILPAPEIKSPVKTQWVINAEHLKMEQVDWGDYPALIEGPSYKIMQIHFWNATRKQWIKLTPEDANDPTAIMLAMSSVQAAMEKGRGADSIQHAIKTP